jgi:membrane protein
VVTRSRSFVSRIWHRFNDDHCMLLAAAIAYYVLFSFIPLMTLMLALFGLIMRDPQSQQGALDHILETMPLGKNVVFDSIRVVSGHRGTLSLIGLVMLVWGSGGMFGAVRTALNITWKVERHQGFIRQQVFDVGAMIGLGILMVASLAGTILVHFLQALSLHSGADLSRTLQIALTVSGVLLPAMISFVAFLLIYREVPNVHHRTSDVWAGALLATVLFELSKQGFALYVSHFNSFQAVYGVLGGVMLFMLWTYIASIILLIGAEFASELKKGPQPRPVDGEPLAP